MDGMAVRVDATNIFEPVALVRCGVPLRDDHIVVEDPIIVFEVASASTQRVDALIKLARDFRNPHIAHDVIVIAANHAVIHHRRHVGDRIEAACREEGRVILDPPGLEPSLSRLFGEAA